MSTRRDPALVVGVLSGDEAFVAQVVAAVRGCWGSERVDGAPLEAGPNESHPALRRVQERARAFLDERRAAEPGSRAEPCAIVRATGVGDLLAQMAGGSGGAPDDGSRLALLFVDLDSQPSQRGAFSETVEQQMVLLRERLETTGRLLYSPYLVHAFSRRLAGEPGAWEGGPTHYAFHGRPPEDWLLRATVTCAFMDFVGEVYLDARVRKHCSPSAPPLSLAAALTDFLNARAGNRWLYFYYTGSIISSFIQSVEERAAPAGVVCLRGPSEHSLACGAIAHWRLFGRPFFIVITSGMIDEFRGTLLNLRDSGAKGFILVAEPPRGQWFAFQGTINGDEDAREVLTAKRIPWVYLDDRQTLAAQLGEAFKLYEAGRGPVVLLATQAVLESISPIPGLAAPSPIGAAPPAADGIGDIARLDEVLRILNDEPCDVAWQCGRLSAEDDDLVHAIAEQAGIALCDSLAHPGTVSKYRHGQVNRAYLGSLGVYGCSPRVYHFFHRDHQLRPRDELCLFFLRSKVPQVATPFTPIQLERHLRVVQVTHTPSHVAPFTDVPVVAPITDFLRAVRSGLRVRPEVRARRLATLEKLPSMDWDVLGDLPALPMSPNYFFKQLGGLIERMIVRDGYEYTGFYEIGRCGISAQLHLPRTGPGYSGWYGRALMGDALTGSAMVALTSPRPVIGVIGDGARALVADPLPSVIENAIANPGSLAHSLSLFVGVNGTLSVIKTYQERVALRPGGRQMRVMGRLERDNVTRYGDVEVHHRTLHSFDPAEFAPLREALLARRRINVFSVVLSHNNQGDGLSLAAARGWQKTPESHAEEIEE